MEYLKFNNYNEFYRWFKTKRFRKTCEISHLNTALFTGGMDDPLYLRILEKPIYDLPDGEMVIHLDLLTDEEKQNLTNYESTKK